MIIDFNNINVSVLKTNSVTITWDSSVFPGTSQIEYGTTISYGSNSIEDSFAYFHIHEIIGLIEGTLYHFRIKTKDYNGIQTGSSDYTFTTRTQSQLDVVIKAARLDGGLPKIYYVSNTIGSDSNNGLTPTSTWKTLMYASSRLDAGDTLYLMNDNWFDDRLASFSRSGIDVARITVKAYPGAKPVMEGTCPNTNSPCTGYNAVDPNSNNYITIEDIEIFHFASGVVFGSTHHNIANNLYVHDTAKAAVHVGSNGAMWNSLLNSTISTISNSVAMTNAIQLSGRIATSPSYLESTYITIKNNTVSNVPYHGGIDLYGWIHFITVDGNTITNINGVAIASTHDVNFDYLKWITIKNNYLYDCCGNDVIGLYAVHDSLIYNNDFVRAVGTSSGVSYRAYTNSSAHWIIKNRFNDSGQPQIQSGTGGYYFIENYINNTKTLVLRSGSSATFINNSANISLLTGTNTATIQYDDNSAFKLILSGTYTIQTPITYTPTQSYAVIQNSGSTATISTSKYAMTARPSIINANITVTKFNTALTTGTLIDCIVNSLGDTINFTISTLKSDTDYLIKKDSSNLIISRSDSLGTISFSDYIFNSHTITIEEISGLDIIPPSVSYITCTTPNEVKVGFSEQVESISSQNVMNYSIDNGITIYSATLQSDNTTVTLSTSIHQSGTNYNITINNIKDLYGNIKTTPTIIQYTFSLPCPQPTCIITVSEA